MEESQQTQGMEYLELQYKVPETTLTSYILFSCYISSQFSCCVNVVSTVGPQILCSCFKYAGSRQSSVKIDI